MNSRNVEIEPKDLKLDQYTAGMIDGAAASIKYLCDEQCLTLLDIIDDFLYRHDLDVWDEFRVNINTATVVRCKDCVHRNTEACCSDVTDVGDYDYCSWGKRRTVHVLSW